MACIPASAIVRVIAQVLGVSGGSGTTTSTPIPPVTEDRFLTQPTVTPPSGNTGQSFTADPGTATVPIDRVEWKLNGAVFSTALTIVSSVSGTFTFQSFAGTAESNVITVAVSAAIPAIVTPFTVGMNSAGAGASGTEFFMRDLALRGRWIVQGGTFNNQDFDPSLLDPVTYFPMSLPGGATGAKLAVTDGAWIGAKGTYTWSIDNRFTVTSTAVKNLDNVNDPDIVFTGSGGSGQVSIGGIPRRSGWSLTVTGPFDALTAGQRGLKILPLNDANPQRLYSDAIRASLVAGGVRHWRPMEDIRTNYADVIPYLTDKGPKTGLPSASVDAIVQLCNDLNMGLTWDFHAVSPDAFINRVSLYVAANLKRGLLFYPAYGNEGDWNEAFPQVNYERHQAWLKGYAASGGTRAPCVGWTATSFVPSGGFGSQPFDPDYTTTSGAPFSGRTNVALNAGDFIFGVIYGNAPSVWRVTANTPSGTVFPQAGNSTFVLTAQPDALNDAKHRFYADRTLAVYQTASAAWVAAGHDVSKCRPIINVQSGPTLGVEKQILDANNFALWSTPFSVQQAPYFYSILGDDVGAGPVAQFLDATFVTDRADIETKQHWVRDRRAAIRAAAPAGITLPDWCHEIYEWNHHNIFGGANRFAFFNAYRRDARLGMLLKYGLTLHARDNPATLLQIFNIVTGEPLDANSGWGIYFYADEALSSSPTNNEGIGLKEWYEAAASGVPSVDVFCATAPAAGSQTISLLFGPQIGTAISGTVRITGGTSPIDLPFTKAANSPTASVTYTAEAGKTYSVNVLPQSGVFTVGAKSLNVAVAVAAAAGPVLSSDFDWRANALALTGVSDGQSISVPVVFGGTALPATSGSAKYVANAGNNKPGIRFDGNTVHTIDRSANAAWFAGKDAQDWTEYYVFTGSIDQDALDCFIQLNGDLDAVRLNRGTDPGTGLALNGVGLKHFTSVVDSGLHVMTVQSRKDSLAAGQTGTGRTMVLLDGLPFIQYVGAIPKPGNKDGTGNSFMGAFFNGIYGANLTLLDAITYNRVHRLVTMWDNTTVLRRFWGNLGMATKIALVAGSSLKTGVSGDGAMYATVSQIIKQCGLPYGSVGCWALGGINFAGLSEMAPEMDELLVRVGAANIFLVAGEGYNELVNSTAAVAASRFVTYLNARLAAGWLPGNIYIDTVTGVTTDRPGYEKYPDYATAVKAIPTNNAGLSAVKLAATGGNTSDTDARVGIGHTTYVTDGVHLSGKPDYPNTISGYPSQVDTVFKAPVNGMGLG